MAPYCWVPHVHDGSSPVRVYRPLHRSWIDLYTANKNRDKTYSSSSSKTIVVNAAVATAVEATLVVIISIANIATSIIYIGKEAIDIVLLVFKASLES